jgi:hypothetical protein
LFFAGIWNRPSSPRKRVSRGLRELIFRIVAEIVRSGDLSAARRIHYIMATACK